MDYDKMKMIKQNKSEIDELNKKYKEIADKLLSEFGPEGAYKISDLLKKLANDDIRNSMDE